MYCFSATPKSITTESCNSLPRIPGGCRMATLAGFGDSDIVWMSMDDAEMHRERLFVFFVSCRFAKDQF